MPRRDPATGRFVSSQNIDTSAEEPLSQTPTEDSNPFMSEPVDPGTPPAQEPEEEEESTCIVCGDNESGVELEGTDGEGVCYDCQDYTGRCTVCESLFLEDDLKLVHILRSDGSTYAYQSRCQPCITNMGDRIQFAAHLSSWQEIEEPAEFTVHVRAVHRNIPSQVHEYIVTPSSMPAIAEYHNSQYSQYELTITSTEEATAELEYRDMNREGTCKYLCGRDATNRREADACDTCAPFTLCPECADLHRPACARCMKSEVAYMEIQETTLRPQRIAVDSYHPRLHSDFKQKKYRLKNEKPYLYYGIEIEVELPLGVNRRKFAETIVLLTEGLFVAERDGSLSNGVEFISRPLSYAAWESEKIQKLLKLMYEKFEYYRVQRVNQSSAGMHVHMSKMFFQKSKTKTMQQQKDDLAWIFEYYDDEIAKLSGRNLNQYCTSKRMLALNQLKHMRIPAKQFNLSIQKEGPVQSQGSGESHHHMISETRSTLEVRTFKSPKKYTEILAFIEMCRNLAHFAREYSIEGYNLHQILHAKKSAALDEYIKESELNFESSKPLEDTITIEYKRR